MPCYEPYSFVFVGLFLCQILDKPASTVLPQSDFTLGFKKDTMLHLIPTYVV